MIIANSDKSPLLIGNNPSPFFISLKFVLYRVAFVLPEQNFMGNIPRLFARSAQLASDAKGFMPKQLTKMADIFKH
ncbi:hypothetical protein BCT27_18645 [Enterovibrio norvegicus]|nr:hypothetical protein BCT27_18645 [Enterovibrio norvegicus]